MYAYILYHSFWFHSVYTIAYVVLLICFDMREENIHVVNKISRHNSKMRELARSHFTKTWIFDMHLGHIYTKTVYGHSVHNSMDMIEYRVVRIPRSTVALKEAFIRAPLWQQMYLVWVHVIRITLYDLHFMLNYMLPNIVEKRIPSLWPPVPPSAYAHICCLPPPPFHPSYIPMPGLSIICGIDIFQSVYSYLDNGLNWHACALTRA